MLRNGHCFLVVSFFVLIFNFISINNDVLHMQAHWRKRLHLCLQTQSPAYITAYIHVCSLAS